MKYTMPHWAFLLLSFFSLQACSSSKPAVAVEKATATPRILVFSKTNGFRHESIPAGKAALQQLGLSHQVQVDTTEDATLFVTDSLQQYDAVVFLSTTMDVLDATQQLAFEEYIRGGGGYVGVHAAADTEYDWPWYNKLVGAYFSSHPQVQKAQIQVLDKNHAATAHLPDVWEREDEWYNFKSMNPEVKVLANLDEKSYTGGENGEKHPIAWYHSYDGGRAFYTALGHTSESYSDSLFLKHLWGGISYAIGEGE
ncbi:ThuA domain-containing protein [Pontibacter rugosus]|uniref:ThuA domain-containing protein n=1 Tax=Pontibacter rugosus TaxID=1745966 RepID=A0ABW3SQF2_9BACT